MSDSPGLLLLHALRQQFVGMLADAAQQAAGLDALTPDPAFEGTALTGHVLTAAGGGGLVLEALARLMGDAGGLHGWDPAGAGGARGLAWAVRPGATQAVALAASAGPSGPRVTLMASGLAGGADQVELAGGWTLRISGQTEASLAVILDLDGEPQVSGSPNDWVELSLARPGPGARVGVPGGPGVTFGAVELGGRLTAGQNGSLDRRGWLRVRGGSVDIAPGALAALLPGPSSVPLDVDLALDAVAGALLAGSPTLRTRLLPAGKGLGGLDIALDVGQGPGGSLALGVTALTSLDVALAGAPVRVRFEGVGLRLPFTLGAGAPLGFDPAAITVVAPSGASVDLALPVVQGSGFLVQTEGEYAGGLSVLLPPLTATAYGVLRPAEGGSPLSFLVLMGATFPPPGIQIGFGFAVTGLGGVVGVNRRVDRDALTRAVTDGSVGNLLFPANPSAAGRSAVHALPAVFPPSPGSVVAGPMFQLSWGNRMVSLSVAVLVEAGGQVRLTILGKLVVAVPDPEVALILLQATFAGTVDPAVPSVVFVASLTGSHIVGMPITGDLLLLSRGGDDPAFVLSAGGFHPAFRPPSGVPALRRLGINLSPSPLVELRCEAYLAITSNTVQFGARLDLVAEVAGCGLRGHAGLDVLVQWAPYLLFMADLSIGIAVEVFGETLVGVQLDLHLQGPTPWRIRGSGSVDLFLFSASFDLDEQWGRPPPVPQVPGDVEAELRLALSRPEAWSVRPSPDGLRGVQLTEAAGLAVGSGQVVDPHAVLTARQRRVPLGLEIDLFDRVPVPAQRWDLTSGALALGRPATLGPPVQEEFAAGQFLARDEHESLSAPAFETFTGGVELLPSGQARPQPRTVAVEWETKLVSEQVARPVDLIGIEGLLELEVLCAAGDLGHPLWWTAPVDRVSVAPTVPVTAVSGWSLMAEPAAPAAATVTELRQALSMSGRSALSVVETWELTP